MRVRSCTERLQDLYEGKIDFIDELEEKQLDIEGNGEKFKQEHISFNIWENNVTANIV